ncbi:MAG: NTP transferase domain-containing protein [Rhodobacteraceae bacterium]|nr:NTP transferase domain-containing protein [Paracoccaceae bacterium]
MPNASPQGLSAVVLAGGFGTRIRHLTGTVPKPLAQVNGKPFLHWIFKSLKAQQIREVYLLTHYEAEQIEAYARSERSSDFEIACIRESSPAGTGGSVLDFLVQHPNISSPFLILNGDSMLVDYDLAVAVECMGADYSGAIFGVEMQDASRYGTLTFNKQYTLTAFQEKTPGAGVINSGVYLFRPESLMQSDSKTRPLSMEQDIIPSLLEKGMKIKIIPEISPFIDIGTEASLGESGDFIKLHFENN